MLHKKSTSVEATSTLLPGACLKINNPILLAQNKKDTSISTNIAANFIPLSLQQN
jgi:hypothetical protein